MRAILALLFSVVAAGCSSIPPFPTTKIVEYDAQYGVCAEYQITDPENFKFKHVRDMPQAECPSMFGFATQDVPKIMSYMQDMRILVRQRCN